MTASDADLGARILAGWQRISRAIEDGPRMNRRLAEHFGVGVREIEHLRDIRNRVAHPGPPVGRRDLERAVATIRQVERRRRGRAPARTRRVPKNTGMPRPGGGRSRSRSGKGRTGATRPKNGTRTRKAKPASRLARTWKLAVDRWAVFLAVVFGVAVAVFVLVAYR